MLEEEWLAMIKGTPNADEALKFLIHASAPEQQGGGNIEQNLEIAVPLNINASNLLLLSQDEFGFKEVARIKIN